MKRVRKREINESGEESEKEIDRRVERGEGKEA